MDDTVHRSLQARILEQVAIPFSRGSSKPRDQTQVSHIETRFFTNWVTRGGPMVPNKSLFPLSRLLYNMTLLPTMKWNLHQSSALKSYFEVCSFYFQTWNRNWGYLERQTIVNETSYEREKPDGGESGWIKVSLFDSSNKPPDTTWGHFGLPSAVKPSQIDINWKTSPLYTKYPNHRIVSNKKVIVLSYYIIFFFWGGRRLAQ